MLPKHRERCRGFVNLRDRRKSDRQLHYKVSREGYFFDNPPGTGRTKVILKGVGGKSLGWCK